MAKSATCGNSIVEIIIIFYYLNNGWSQLKSYFNTFAQGDQLTAGMDTVVALIKEWATCLLFSWRATTCRTVLDQSTFALGTKDYRMSMS